MFYVAVYPHLAVSIPCQKPETIERCHSHFRPRDYPIATVFAETESELNLAIKECLRQLRAQR